MKLNPSQIHHLYTFTRQHYVEYYDLQTELVDHLANAIEAEWEQNPQLSFDEALNKEYRKFGVFGFMDVVEKRQIVLSKKYKLLVWEHFKEFFTVPKIIVTSSLIACLFLILRIAYWCYFFPVAMLFLFIVILPFAFFTNNKIKKHQQTTGKVWLFEKTIINFGNTPSLFLLPLHFFNLINPIIIKDFNSSSTTFLFCISSLTVSIYLVAYIIIIVIPQRAEEYLKQTYPEYEFTN